MQTHSQNNLKNQPAITVKNLCIAFGVTHVIDHVSFAIPKGAVSAIIGPNGSGKTTLIRAILGLQEYGGNITLFGEPEGKQSCTIGYVPQRFDFDRTTPMTAEEFLMWTITQSKNHEDPEKVWKTVGLDESAKKTLIGELSGGQMQRLLLAQALLQKPDLLILDEPDANIDTTGEKQLEDIMKEYCNRGGTVVMISHDITFVARAVEHVICLNKQLVCSGPPAKTLSHEALEQLFHNANPYHHH